MKDDGEIMDKVVILFSGGKESRLLLERALQLGMAPYCVLIDYEQRHKQELAYASMSLNSKSIPWQEIKLHKLDVHSALTDGKGEYSGVSEWYVPQRNLMFISIAASIAESMGINRIWYGASYTDREDLFPDCYQEWVYNINAFFKVSGINITVEAPLLGYTEDMVWKELDTIGVDRNEIYSGYGEL